MPATEWITNTAKWFKSLYFNTRFLQLLYFISLAQQPTGQAAKRYDSETIQCAGAGRDYLYLDLFTAAKTLFWGTSLSTLNPFCPRVCSFWGIRETSLCARNVLFPREQTGFLAEHLICKNVQPWLRVSFASTSQPSLNLVPYTGQNISFARMFSPGWESHLQALLNLLYTSFLTLFDINHSKILYDPPSRVMEINTKI